MFRGEERALDVQCRCYDFLGLWAVTRLLWCQHRPSSAGAFHLRLSKPFSFLGTISCNSFQVMFFVVTTFLFLKLYFIDYAITVVLIFPLLLACTQDPPLPWTIPPPLCMSMGDACKFFGYSISYSVVHIPMAIP